MGDGFLYVILHNYSERFMDSLWVIINRPRQRINDWKKSHGAACFLGSLLSRAAFIDFRTSMYWMEKLMKWCHNYVNQAFDLSSNVVAGDLCHGTFYAVCQALIVTFCFRYHEFVKYNELSKIRHWGLGRVINCSLEPLVYIDRLIAFCFASISRSLQLVYCHHVIRLVTNDKVPFEPYFPFDSYSLERCIFLITLLSYEFINSLIRRFSPLADDKIRLKNEIYHFGKKCAIRDNDSESMDFLDDVSRDQEMFGGISFIFI
ncbi:unnamed protein product [Dracunculus medinensis]|uniref:TLC domain-containing protein n=1 Tax=Dracunculus medinensis TaxID=318479 RepID=A0A0N4UJP4_DRAME|nr:unnamed protein product [Dracunculus medinensis]